MKVRRGRRVLISPISRPSRDDDGIGTPKPHLAFLLFRRLEPMKIIANTFFSHAPYGLIVVAFSAAYYALYINSGFNFSDAGNYAQICYELFLGKDPAELVIGYGILWFKVGEFLFRIFGVDYALVNFIFFFCIVITNVLVFYVVNLATGTRPIALSAAAISALVPAFPATSFYALCVLLNVAAQMRLARGSLRPWDAALAGIALSFTFQIRPDFGYVFAVPLVVLIALATFEQRGRWHVLSGAALAGFFVTLLFGLLAAMAGGYGSVFLQQFMGYPAMMAGYFIDGVRALFFERSLQGEFANALLARPSIAGVFSDEAQIAQLALLIYLPILMATAFAILNAALFFGSERNSRFDVLAPAIVALSSAAAVFPHYFFYRPDMSHIANFMPGYIVLLAMLASQIHQRFRKRMPIWERFAGSAALAVLAVNLGVYLWAGLHSPGTGSIAIAAGRAEAFTAGNGVDVIVTPEEKAELGFLRDIVSQNSVPGDTIVCVPYCPGVAFMTERRMLLPNFYVDDAILTDRPGWLVEASDLTRYVKPAVVIVIDWAINGTDHSRFDVWAAPYVVVVKGLSRNKVVNGNITAYIL